MYWLVLNGVFEQLISINSYQANDMNFQVNGLYNQQVKPSPVDVIEQIITTGLTQIQIFDVKQNELINTDLYNTFNNFYISIVPGSENEFNFSFIIK